VTTPAAFGRGWIVYPAPNPSARVRLFCLPHGGGAASVFREWATCLPAFEVAAIQLPGRESRLGEPPLDRMGEVLDQLLEDIRPHLGRPFALFGHSAGARVAFELARRLRADGGPEPVRLYVSACPAPQLPQHPPLHGLPDAELTRLLRDLGGTPPEVFEFPELVAMLLAVVRADFAVVETCAYTHEAPFDYPIHGFVGTGDSEADAREVDAWRAQTHASFTLHVLAGDHFFPWEQRTAVLGLIAADLADVGRGSRVDRGPHARRPVR
jgi:medium-chain acyl-[acyl-carrier-protein] hydrolase